MKIPTQCPSCYNKLNVNIMKCISCATKIEGNYKIPLYFRLSIDEQNFIRNFFTVSGSK